MQAFKTTFIASMGAFLIGAASVAPDMAVAAKVVNSDSAPKSRSERKSGVTFPVTHSDGANFDPGDGAGYSALGIARINGSRVAVYALQNGAKLNDVAGEGQGFADVFDSAGHLLRRFTFRENLNSPPQIMEYISLPPR
ncbi:MAG: hypothetical protein WBQ86_12465 [Candidatus Binatus sp.]